MADVFISYKREERSSVARIEEALRANEFSVWFDAQLDLGQNEGFYAHIDREVTSAAAVLVCWSPQSVKSRDVRAEAKKGLDRDVLVPVFLSPSVLPVPFNDVDAVDLSEWKGDPQHPSWLRVVTRLKELKARSSKDQAILKARSAIAYRKVTDKVFPGTLAELCTRIVALGDWDGREYHDDLMALCSWAGAILKKEVDAYRRGYDLAERQPGGGAWYYWEDGRAATRATQIDLLKAQLQEICIDLEGSIAVLKMPAP